MKDRKWWQIIRLYLVASIFVVFQVSCGFGKYGKAEVDSFNINVPSGLNGQSKTNIVKMLGAPHSTVSAGGTEYWKYENHNGWYVYLFYVSFGSTETKDLILELRNDKVETAYLLNKGSSIGILTAPSSVAN